MRICIFSDVHGNSESLDKMLSCETENVDAFVFAGDIWGYFYDQPEIIDRLINIENLIAVKGNHDEYYLSDDRSNELLNKYGSSYLTDISNEQMSFMQSLPDYLDITIKGKRVGIYHGGTMDFLEQRVYPDSTIAENSVFEQYDYLILGHTHYRMCRKINDALVINPGSLGQPRDGNGFSYCILDTETGRIDFKNVIVDIDKLLLQAEKKDGEKEVYEYLKRKYKRT